VIRAGIDVQLNRHAIADEPTRIFNVLFNEQIELTNGDNCDSIATSSGSTKAIALPDITTPSGWK
jgi:hypothetical protein